MKGHTVPWGFLPSTVQFILAVVLIVFVVRKTYRDLNAVARWWPWLFAVATVLSAPTMVWVLGFGSAGIQAKSLAAEIQSLATSFTWLQPTVSALQSISTKGMGFKTAGVLFMAGGAFGRMLVVPGFRQYGGAIVRLLGQPQALQDQQRQPLEEGQQQQQQQRPEPGDQQQQQEQQHPHAE